MAEPGAEQRGRRQLISNTRVEYKQDNSGAGDGYGPPRMSGFFPHSTTYTCQDDRNYWIGVR